MVANAPAYEMLLNRWWRAKESIRSLRYARTRSETMAREGVAQISAINTYRETIRYVQTL